MIKDAPVYVHDLQKYLYHWKNFVLNEGVLNNIAANRVLATPNGSSGVASFRALVSNDIPNLNASKITTGAFDTARIPNLDASKITTGVFGTARIPNLDTSKFTTGIFDNARINWASPNALGNTTPNTVYATNLLALNLYGNYADFNDPATISAGIKIGRCIGSTGTWTLPLASGYFHSNGGVDYSAILMLYFPNGGSPHTFNRQGSDTIEGSTSIGVTTSGQGAVMFAAFSSTTWFIVGVMT